MKSRRVKLSSLICLSMALALSQAHADWSRISASVEEIKSNWLFESGQRSSRVTRINMQFEEKTSLGFTVGANLGRLDAQISNVVGERNTTKFDASYVGVYLRYPLAFGEYFTLQNKLGYQYNTGSENSTTGDSDIDWRELSVELGLSARFGNLRITPFAFYSDISGDISGELGTDSFETKNDISGGLSIDLFIEQTSVVRLRLTSGEQDSASLVFAREF